MTMSNKLRRANRRMAGRLFLVTVAMFGFGYALIPLYDVFCDITGLNGKTRNQAVAASDLPGEIDTERLVTVEFIASTSVDAPWEFKPEVVRMQVHPGQFYQTSYMARNLTGQALTGHAVPSVAPGLAASHFHKIECFCFNQQDFGPGETKDMPIIFQIDPRLDKDVGTVTLSYTFFKANPDRATRDRATRDRATRDRITRVDS